MHHPDPRPTPPAGEPAAGQGRSRARRPRPGPPGFTYEVQLVGGEAGRLLAQEQAEAVAAVLAWLAGHPPTDLAGSAATDAPGTAPRAEHGDASRDAASPTTTGRASGRQHAAGDGGPTGPLGLLGMPACGAAAHRVADLARQGRPPPAARQASPAR
jgi:hypothetical protein